MHERTSILKKNIIYSSILKVIGVMISFLLLPITVSYLTNLEYGIWITLFSIMNWVTLLDMGLGLGLRNKLTEAVSKNDFIEIKKYISTGIFSMLLIGIFFILLFLISLQFINLQIIFNTNEFTERELYNITLLSGIFIIISFIFSIINQIFYAYQKAGLVGGIQIIHNIIMLIMIYILILLSIHDIIYFVISFGIAVIISRGIFFGYFFYNNKNLTPSIKFFGIKNLKNITKLGVKFFIIQICCIIGLSSNNIVITQFLGPEYVRNYDICIKIFSFVLMLQSLITTPLWSSITDAYVKKDILWIKNILKKMYITNILLSILIIILGVMLKNIIQIWLGINIHYSYSFILYMIVYYIFSLWGGVFTAFLNGIGKINIQLIAWVISSAGIIPLVYLFTKILKFELEGIILAYLLPIIFLVVVLFFNIKYILNKFKKGDL